jgi:hypothetical protein
MKCLLGAVMIASCATTSAPPPEIGPTLGTTHVKETGAITATTNAPIPHAAPPREAQFLLVATDELQTSPTELAHAQLVSALYALADALEVVAPERAADILSVREATNQLGRSDLEATMQGALTRTAFDAATRAIDHAQPPAERDRQRLADAVVAMHRATDGLDPHRSLTEQTSTLRSAFRASVYAVYAATGAAEPEIAATPTPTAIR